MRKQTMLTEVEWHQYMGNNNQRWEWWKENENYLYKYLMVQRISYVSEHLTREKPRGARTRHRRSMRLQAQRLPC